MLAAWDVRADVGSRGEVLWREYWSRLRRRRRPVDGAVRPGRPGQHAARARRRRPEGLAALRGAVEDLRAKGIALDVPLGDLQAEPRGSERIPIPGCSEGEGCFNIISTRRDDAGQLRPVHGLVVRDGGGVRRQGPPARLGDPVLLAVREPATRRTTPTRRGCSRRSSGCRCASPSAQINGRPGLLEAGGDRPPMSDGRARRRARRRRRLVPRSSGPRSPSRCSTSSGPRARRCCGSASPRSCCSRSGGRGCAGHARARPAAGGRVRDRARAR